MIHVNKKQDCCGCSACEQICPKEAISMEKDPTGFFYPVVNEDVCVGCGLCEKACPILNENESREPKLVYGLKNNDLECRLSSSSGGVFSCLAQDIVKQHGVVYGAAFEEDWSVSHIRVDTLEELERLKGSKYVQSKIGEVYKQVKQDLLNGKRVLFSGCPCQVAGLNQFLRKKYENLTTIDVVCHGVPNPRIWKEYIEQEIGNREILIDRINFRDKSTGWNKFSFSIEGRSIKTGAMHSEKAKAWSHTYMQLFLYDFIARPSCHSCHFRNGKSGADMTMGDFWTVERNYADFYDDNGVSALLIYKGDLPLCVEKSCDKIEASYQNVCFGNPAIKWDWPPNRMSKIFYFAHDRLKFDLKTSLMVGLLFQKRIISFRKMKTRIIVALKKILCPK